MRKKIIINKTPVNISLPVYLLNTLMGIEISAEEENNTFVVKTKDIDKKAQEENIPWFQNLSSFFKERDIEKLVFEK